MPFTAAEFLQIFREYNTSVWPMQIVLTAAGVGCVMLLIRGGAHASRVISAILALLWSWMAVGYHFAYFARVNPAAILFGSIFLVEAVLLFWYGTRAERLRFGVTRDAYGLVGIAMIAFALVGYPLLGFALGRRYPESPTFGLPWPTTIFTLGLLLLARPPLLKRALIIPSLWSVVGAFAATSLGVEEDFSLLAAGVVTIVLVLWRDRSTVIRRRLAAPVR